MILYSDTINSFIARIKKYAFSILKEETDLKVKSRFIYFKNYRYEPQFLVFEGGQLGICNPRLAQIGLNSHLMYSAKSEVIKNILRHELAHFLTTLHYGYDISPHGAEYKSVCRQYGWGKNVWAAQGNIEQENADIEGDIPGERIIIKIKKLMSLSQSDNKHESELATAKANQLLLRHNLKKINHLEFQNQQNTYVKNLLKSKRINAKMNAIFEILTTFYVYPVYNQGDGEVYIQIIGSKENVQLADYVASFLDRELERLWQINRKKWRLSGNREKKWFMLGLAKGYKEKIEQHIAPIIQANKKDIVILQDNLNRHVRLVHPRLGKIRHSLADPNIRSGEIGHLAGGNLSINPAVKSGHKKTTGLLNTCSR
ncbi:MAG: DUF2786 domain-containing protein [Halobacteriovoraceae bacterium]|nr:DUF2786 domain-containing protein [Halobacteriovoraceae bacterium]